MLIVLFCPSSLSSFPLFFFITGQRFGCFCFFFLFLTVCVLCCIVFCLVLSFFVVDGCGGCSPVVSQVTTQLNLIFVSMLVGFLQYSFFNIIFGGYCPVQFICEVYSLVVVYHLCHYYSYSVSIKKCFSFFLKLNFTEFSLNFH